jgi:hypothetical protein
MHFEYTHVHPTLAATTALALSFDFSKVRWINFMNLGPKRFFDYLNPIPLLGRVR